MRRRHPGYLSILPLLLCEYHNTRERSINRRTEVILQPESVDEVYHIVHPETIAWSTILDGLEVAEMIFDRVEPSVWLEKLEKSLGEDDPSRQMLGMWRAAVSVSCTHDHPGCAAHPLHSPGRVIRATIEKLLLMFWRGADLQYAEQPGRTGPMIDTRKAQRASETLREIKPVTEELIVKMVKAWRESGFLR